MLLHYLGKLIIQIFCSYSARVKIWQSCREFKGGNFFETQCRVHYCGPVHWRIYYIIILCFIYISMGPVTLPASTSASGCHVIFRIVRVLRKIVFRYNLSPVVNIWDLAQRQPKRLPTCKSVLVIVVILEGQSRREAVYISSDNIPYITDRFTDNVP